MEREIIRNPLRDLLSPSKFNKPIQANEMLRVLDEISIFRQFLGPTQQHNGLFFDEGTQLSRMATFETASTQA